jgi:hypothetical protein
MPLLSYFDGLRCHQESTNIRRRRVLLTDVVDVAVERIRCCFIVPAVITGETMPRSLVKVLYVLISPHDSSLSPRPLVSQGEDSHGCWLDLSLDWSVLDHLTIQ